MATKAELLEQAEAQGVDVPSGATKADIEALVADSNTSSDTEVAKSETKANRTAEPQGTSETEANSTTDAPSSAEADNIPEPGVTEPTEEAKGGEVRNEFAEENPNAGEKRDEAPELPSADTVVLTVETDETEADGTPKTEELTVADEVKRNDVTEVRVHDPESATMETVVDENRTERQVRFADEQNPNQRGRRDGAQGSDYDQDGNLRTGGKSYGVADDVSIELQREQKEANVKAREEES